MWKLVFHITSILNRELVWYEPENYTVEVTVSADEMFDCINTSGIYIEGVGDIDVHEDQGRSPEHGVRIFDDCHLNED